MLQIGFRTTALGVAQGDGVCTHSVKHFPREPVRVCGVGVGVQPGSRIPDTHICSRATKGLVTDGSRKAATHLVSPPSPFFPLFSALAKPMPHLAEML